MEKITRRIQFYKVTWARRNGDIITKNSAFFDSILTQLCGVKGVDPSYDVSLEQYNKATLQVTDPNKSFYKLSKIRKTDLPLKYDYDQGADLPLGLEPNEGLSEPGHFAVFNGVFIGAEYNHYAPRIAILVEHINNQLNSNPIEDLIGVQITPILKPGILERIDRITYISSIYIKIATDYARLISQQDNSLKSLLSAADLTEDAFLKIEFSIGAGRKLKRAVAFERIIGPLKVIISRRDDMGSIKDAQIRGKEIGSSVPDTFDLLEEQLIAKREVTAMDAETRAVNPIEMYKAILNTYSALRSDLERFTSV